MANWIKVEFSTPDKPEVFTIAQAMGIDPDAVVGKAGYCRPGHRHPAARSLLDDAARRSRRRWRARGGAAAACQQGGHHGPHGCQGTPPPAARCRGCDTEA